MRGIGEEERDGGKGGRGGGRAMLFLYGHHHASPPSPQVPAIMTHAPFLDPCTNGVGYSLLMVVPSFYLLASILFAILGFVMVCWSRMTGSADFAYEKVKNDEEVPPVSP